MYNYNIGLDFDSVHPVHLTWSDSDTCHHLNRSNAIEY